MTKAARKPTATKKTARKKTAPKPIANEHPAITYARQVDDGTILSCKWIKLAAKRFLNDLTRADIFFCEKSANRAIGFIETFRHYKGDFAGRRMLMEPWQKFVVANIFGWLRKVDGRRRFRYAHIEVPRKNGKTLLAAGIANYMLCADREPGSEVYCVATKKEQAMILFRDARVLIDKCGDAEFREAFEIRRNPAIIEYPDAESFLKPLGRDTEGDTADGLNPHCIIADEIHAWTSLGYWNVLNSALGARSQPLFFQITTAGHNLESVGRKQRKILERILNGEDGGEGDDYFGVIYTIDEGDDIEDPKTWAKANPLYGITVDERKFRSQLALAKADPSIMRELKTKWLNIWLNQASSWLDSQKWEMCHVDHDAERLKGLRCYGGLDLSITRDLSAFTLLFPPQEGLDRWTVLSRFWCPADDIDIRSRRDKVPYRTWQEQKFIVPTPGEVTDHEYIRKQIMEDNETYDLRAVGFDRAYSQHIVGPLIDGGVNMLSMSQGIMTISPYAQELEKLIIQATNFNHMNNPVLTWCAGNVTIETDANGNIKPSKKKSEERIDGIIALIMSLGVGLEMEYEGGWDDPDHGVTTF